MAEFNQRGDGDFGLQVSRGLIGGMVGINKFGRNTDIDTAAAEDIWFGGGTWTLPTQARIHNITSSSANDTDGGTGARTIMIYGLTDWDTKEVAETITMNGTSNVATANAYVALYRARVLTKGASGPNVGNITAIAQTDGTTTFSIQAGSGTTQIAALAFPSVQDCYVLRLYANILKSGGSAVSADMGLFYNPTPNDELLGFINQHEFAVASDAAPNTTITFAVAKKFAGPGIIKINAEVSANNADVSGGFDCVLVDN